jgi:hypothetical protein
MPTVAELTAVYGNFMIGPRRGADVCERCFNLTRGFERCYACAHTPQWLDLIAPISYSIGGEQLHHALASYKRLSGDPGPIHGRAGGRAVAPSGPARGLRRACHDAGHKAL